MTAILFALLACGLPNLDFSRGDLHGWEGAGLALDSGRVSSVAAGTGLLHRTFRVPADAAFIRFRAAAWRAGRPKPGAHLDVVLEGAGRSYLPRQVLRAGRWTDAAEVLPPDRGELRPYRWDVSGHAGKMVRLALVDTDDRAGCYVVSSGFEIVTRDEHNAGQFADALRVLHEKHGQPKAWRLDSRRFLVYSTADRAFTEKRLQDCELIYSSFFTHFRRRGLSVREPREKLMVAVFGSQKGLDAYVGQPLGPVVTGLYHLPTNRLLVYDYATNASFLETKRSADDLARGGATDLDRHARSVLFGRALRSKRDDVNVATVMHEVAHHLSFNTGLLSRSGDVPLWLAEGLAVYCESTSGGSWQGIGEPNPHRVAALTGKGGPYRLRDLVVDDNWYRKSKSVEAVVAGYSQSWLLFRLLIEEQPRQLRSYLEAIQARRTPDHRLTDFAGAFGDVRKLERRYEEYVREVVRKEGK